MNATTAQSQQEAQLSRRSYFKPFAAALLVFLPAILFYSILFSTALNIPWLDDYEAILKFVNGWKMIDGLSTKASYFLASQHNEYKLFFEQAVVLLQFDLLGRIDFRWLSAIGNGFVLLLAFLLWKMFLPTRRDVVFRLALFLPVSCLLFQLQYKETLNWAMAGLQNIPVLFFSFASVYLLQASTRRAFTGALAFYVLAVASSGNGFLLLPIGLLILAIGRRYAQIAAWLIASVGCVVAYSYHYDVMSSQSSPHHSVFSTLLRLRPGYVVSFIGSAASIPFHAASFVLGTALCVFFAWMTYRGYIRRNPTVSCCVLFLLLTSIGVAGIRSDLGLTQSLSSRYAIYSALFLIFAWFAIVEEFLQRRRIALLNSGMYLSAVAAAAFLCLFMDGLGFLMFQSFNGRLIQGMAAFEHPNPPNSTEGPDIGLWNYDPESAAFKARARAILIESIKLDVYQPPVL